MPHPKPERHEHAPPGNRLLARLTSEQGQTVTHGTGPLLLIAGPEAARIVLLMNHRAPRTRTSLGSSMPRFPSTPSNMCSRVRGRSWPPKAMP